MITDVAKEYVSDWPQEGKRFNCAEATLRACNDYYSLGLDENALKFASAFGGGMSTGKTCGVLIGGVAALGIIYANDQVPYGNPTLKEKVQVFQEAFEEEFKDSNCTVVKDVVEEQGCSHAVIRGCELLEEIVGKPEEIAR